MSNEKPINATILYVDAGRAESVDVRTGAKTFDHDNQKYKIREKGKYRLIKIKLTPIPPFFERVVRIMSFYRAGNPEPIVWKPSDKFTSEDLYALDKEDTTIAGIADSMKGERRKKQIKGLKWLFILMLVAIGVIAFIFFLPVITGMVGGG